MGRLKEWKDEILEHKWLILLSIIFLIVASILNLIAGRYVDKINGVAATDLILDHLPVIDFDFIFVYGFILIIAALILYPLFFKVKELHVAISQFSLLVIIRSFFTSLTHLTVPTGAVLVIEAPKFFDFLNFQNALFFSGHTAVPFLGFLLFRKDKISWFFLGATLVMAMVVLFMHVHYSIDVFAALFITYGSYKIGSWLFRKVNHY